MKHTRPLAAPPELRHTTTSVLIVGVDSQIGGALFQKLSRLTSYRVFGTSRKVQPRSSRNEIIKLDLNYPDSFIKSKKIFDHVIFCAGLTDMKGCESDPALCLKINVNNTVTIIRNFIESGSHVIFLSSNAVFDGSKAFPSIYDHPNPINNYGKSKLEVEKTFQADPNFAVLRLTKVITATTPFIIAWLDSLDRGQPIKVFEDRLLSPINIDDVTEKIHLLIKHKVVGTFQLGGSTELSYADFANTLFSNNPIALRLLKVEKGLGQLTQKHNSLATFLPISYVDQRPCSLPGEALVK